MSGGMKPRGGLTRRQVVAGASAAALTRGCSRQRTPRVKPRVCILKASYGNGLADAIRRLLQEHKAGVRGKHVLLKPNLVEFDPETAINTHPALVAAVLDACRALGAASVRIAEGPGHRRPTLELAEAAGYFAAIPDFESLFTDLNLDDVTQVRLPRSAPGLETVYFPKTVLRSGLILSLAKLKTHHWAGVTLSMKNLFGLVPGAVYGWPKNVLHWAGIEDSILAINSVFPNVFAIVDGIEGMEGNGPIQGRRKHAGVVVGGADRVAVDATCCRVMGIDPRRVRYLEEAAGAGQTIEENVVQTGEPVASVSTPFALMPEFRSIRLQRAS